MMNGRGHHHHGRGGAWRICFAASSWTDSSKWIVRCFEKECHAPHVPSVKGSQEDRVSELVGAEKSILYCFFCLCSRSTAVVEEAGVKLYLVDLLSADGVAYHKSCFKCSHCKSTLKLSSYNSMEGVLYCKPHFEQLFKETGNFNKNFQSPAKSAEKLTPELTRSPSKAASMFSGTQDKCATCGKTAYPLEKVTVESQSYHKSCFKCSHGGCPITPSNYAALEGILYCKHHFSQLFKEKGSYNHLIKSASMKRAAASIPEA
ncbi:hypothetical protein NL676_037054 [Syzygium grande]|nr:hypothetical protein NL676_037054 [Syzygium grande]